MVQRFNADEVFSMGVQIEKNGFAFYSAAAENTEDTDLKDLFLRLAEWERKHVTIFESLRMNIPAAAKETDAFDQDNMVHLYLKSVADNNVFVKGLTLDPATLVWTSPVNVLTTALDFEKDSVVFFSSMKEVATEKSAASEVDKLVTEELRHIGFLTGEIRKLGG